MPPLQITVVVSDRVGDLVKGRNTAGQSQLLRAQESVLRTLSMALRAPAPRSVARQGGGPPAHTSSWRIDILRGGL